MSIIRKAAVPAARQRVGISHGDLRNAALYRCTGAVLCHNQRGLVPVLMCFPIKLLRIQAGTYHTSQDFGNLGWSSREVALRRSSGSSLKILCLASESPVLLPYPHGSHKIS